MEKWVREEWISRTRDLWGIVEDEGVVSVSDIDITVASDESGSRGFEEEVSGFDVDTEDDFVDLKKSVIVLFSFFTPSLSSFLLLCFAAPAPPFFFFVSFNSVVVSPLS